MQENVEQVKPERSPTENPAVQGKTGIDQGTIVGLRRWNAVPEMMGEGEQRAPGVAHEGVVGDQMLVAEDETEPERREVEPRRQCRHGDAGGVAPALHEPSY